MKVVSCKFQVVQGNWKVGMLLLLSFALSACGGAYRGVGNLSQLDNPSRADILPDVDLSGIEIVDSIEEVKYPLHYNPPYRHRHYRSPTHSRFGYLGLGGHNRNRYDLFYDLLLLRHLR